MEFKLISPENFVKVIQFNYDDLHKWITEQVEKYQNIVYTDDNIKSAKEDRAKLNKFRESIDAARKDVKKRYLEPYNNFEKQVKDLLELIDKPTKAIDVQVKTYEDKKKADKRKQIEQYFNATVGDLSKLVTLDSIFVQKWLNSTVSMKNVQAEIDDKIVKIRSDIHTIKLLKSEWELTLIDTYLKTFDVSAALQEKTRLEERQKELQMRERQIAEQTAEEKPKEEPKEEPKAEEPEPIKEVKEEKIYTRKLWIQGTKEQLRALGHYMKDNGIDYAAVK